MIRPMNDAAAEEFLSALERIDRRIENAQRQIATGHKISFASDQPDEIGRLLAARADLGRTVQVLTNLGRIKAETDAGEQALQQVAKILEQAIAQGAQGASETQTAEQRRSVAAHIADALAQVVNLAATTVEGRYIFSGDSDQVAPYALDPARPNGVSLYAGSAATRQTEDPAGQMLAIGSTAQEIFDDADGGIFAALSSLASALGNCPNAGDPDYQAQFKDQTDAIDAAIGAVRTASNHLAAAISHFGALQNRIDGAIDYGHQLETRKRAELSAIEDADISAAAIELNEADTHRQAAFAAYARQSATTLFDYLK